MAKTLTTFQQIFKYLNWRYKHRKPFSPIADVERRFWSGQEGDALRVLGNLKDETKLFVRHLYYYRDTEGAERLAIVRERKDEKKTR